MPDTEILTKLNAKLEAIFEQLNRMEQRLAVIERTIQNGLVCTLPPIAGSAYEAEIIAPNARDNAGARAGLVKQAGDIQGQSPRLPQSRRGIGIETAEKTEKKEKKLAQKTAKRGAIKTATRGAIQRLRKSLQFIAYHKQCQDGESLPKYLKIQISSGLF